LAAYSQYFLLLVATKITLSAWLVALKIKGGNKLTFQKNTFYPIIFLAQKNCIIFLQTTQFYTFKSYN
jgi:hypothetical protein